MADSVRRCIFCECTDLEPCIDRETGETCGWALLGDKPVCSFCAEIREVLATEAIAAADPAEPLVEVYSEGEANAFIRAMGASA